MRKQLFSFNALIPVIALLGALPVQADSVSLVTVDTTSVAGSSGFLDFTFDPGPFPTQSAFAGVSGFASDGTLGAPAVSGDVTGSLPPSMTLNNDTPFNDYFTAFTFGDTLSFSLTLGGPAVDSPDGLAASGSTFAFSVFSDDGATPLLTSDTLDGFAFTIDVELNGSAKLTNFSAATSVTQAISAVPEPATGWLCGACLMALIAGFRRYSTQSSGRD